MKLQVDLLVSARYIISMDKRVRARQYAREYYAANRDTILEKRKTWYHRTKDKHMAQTLARRKANPKAHRDYMREYMRKRRANPASPSS